MGNPMQKGLESITKTNGEFKLSSFDMKIKYSKIWYIKEFKVHILSIPKLAGYPSEKDDFYKNIADTIRKINSNSLE